MQTFVWRLTFRNLKPRIPWSASSICIPLQCTKLSTSVLTTVRTKANTAKYSTLDKTDSFTLDPESQWNFSMSYSARKVGRNLYDIFQVTTPWSLQLLCGACMDSLGQWNWRHVAHFSTRMRWCLIIQKRAVHTWHTMPSPSTCFVLPRQ